MPDQYIAFAILISSIAWAFVILAIATMADRQVTRIYAAREEVDLDKRLEAYTERVDEQLHSFYEALTETQKAANSAAVAVGLSPSDRSVRKPDRKA